jgi:hypothetical protein
VTDLAALAAAIDERVAEPPWPGHEHVRGWGVFGLPFDSGHVLALRVFPQGTFGPYRTVWHRDPSGSWGIHADAREPALACPRYYGAACDVVATARIDVAWTGPRSLRVTMDDPALEWTIDVRRGLDLVNAVSARMPLASWRRRPLVRARELMGRALGMGSISLAGAMPSGHSGLLMPQRMYLVGASTAVLAGQDLGRPTRLRTNPTIGGVPLPARGVLAFGQAVWRIQDPDEHARARAAAGVPTTETRRTMP